jgi:hypothetical protein
MHLPVQDAMDLDKWPDCFGFCEPFRPIAQNQVVQACIGRVDSYVRDN